MKSVKIFGVLSIGIVFMAFTSSVLAGPGGPALGVSPATIAWTSNAWVTVTVSNLTAGAKVDISLYVDVQSNGVVDAVDQLLASFRVQDGVTNSLGSSVIVDDEDGSANGTVVSRLAYFGQEGAFHVIGNYLWQARTVSGGTSVVTRFSVTQPTSTVWITGSVVNYMTTSPVPAAAVWLEYFDEKNAPEVWTDTNGAFKLYLPSGVSTADVERVGAMGLGYFNPSTDPTGQEPISEYVFTNDLQQGANSLPIALRVVPKVPSMIFEVSGHVYDDQTNALRGVAVCVEWNDGNDESTAITDTNGLYRLCMWGAWNAYFYADEESLMRLGLVSVGENRTVTNDMTGVDLYCPRATVLARGKVLAADNSAPIASATVWFENDMYSGCGVSLADGTYEVGLVSFTNYQADVDSYSIASQGFLGAWTNVSIASGPFTNAQFRLERGYPVAGHVYDADTNALTGGYVGAYRYPAQNSQWYNTGVNRHGAYRLLAPTGVLAISASEFYGFIGQQYADPVTNTAAGTAGIDFYLEPGAIISGQVLADGNPLGNVQVQAFVTIYMQGGGSYEQGVAWVGTDANGYYTLMVQPGVEYGVRTQAPEGTTWLRQYYNNELDAASATLVTPTLDVPAIDINFNLQPGATISGRVLVDGNPQADVQVEANIITDFGGGSWSSYGVEWNNTDANGYYTLVVQPGVNYGIRVWRPSGDGSMFGIYYSNTTSGLSATLVTPTLDVPVTDINFALTGTVTPPADGDGNGLPDWWELQHFGGTGVNPNAVCSNGINTVIQAYVAGLNPTNSSARFGITNHAQNLIQWSAVSGRVYNVYWTTNLMNGFQCSESNIPWTRTSFTNPAVVPCGYYKIDVRLE